MRSCSFSIATLVNLSHNLSATLKFLRMFLPGMNKTHLRKVVRTRKIRPAIGLHHVKIDFEAQSFETGPLVIEDPDDVFEHFIHQSGDLRANPRDPSDNKLLAHIGTDGCSVQRQFTIAHDHTDSKHTLTLFGSKHILRYEFDETSVAGDLDDHIVKVSNILKEIGHDSGVAENLQAFDLSQIPRTWMASNKFEKNSLICLGKVSPYLK